MKLTGEIEGFFVKRRANPKLIWTAADFHVSFKGKPKSETYMSKIVFIIFLFTTINVFADEMVITQGRAITDIENLYECGIRYRKSGIGHIIDQSENRWVVPAPVAFTKARKATDLYNQCTHITPTSIDDVNIDSVPVVEIDHDGEVITGFLFADNYFELYVNGHLVGVDSVPFTQFNSSIVRFRVKRPIIYAVRLVDWEENLGLGSENNRGNKYHAGDGGFVASFSDGTITDSSWKAQTYYIAPIDSPSNVRIVGNIRDTSQVQVNGLTCKEICFAAHWPVPKNWFKKDFDDNSWPSATVYTNEIIGVNNKPAYMNFSELFIGKKAKFIWSSNVVLDNHVIVRKTVK